MKNGSLKAKVMSGLFWRFSERIAAQAVTFIVSIILARLLEPSSYGVIAIVNIFIAIANVFVIGSFGNSLIQKKEADDIDFSSVFYLNIVLGIIFYSILFVAAPFVAQFYDMPILCQLLRVMGVSLIIAGVNSVQQAYVSKNMMFRRFFWSTLWGTIVSAVIGITMAYIGFGVWALVAQYMVKTVINTLILWFTVKWRPKLLFSLRRLGSLFSYGWKLLASSLLDTGYNELRSLVIGKMYTSSDLAFYNKGKSFPDIVVTNINSSIQSVLFPAMADCQDEKEEVKAMTRRSIRISSYIMFPMMAGLAIVAEPLIKLLLTEKWLSCVPYLQISCFVFAFMPIHTANLQAIKAMGRSDIFLKLEIIKKTIGLFVLIAVMRYGVLAIALSATATTIISAFINAFPNRKLLNYNYIEQIKDLFNGIVPLLLMSVSVVCINFFDMSEVMLLPIKIVLGIIMYITSSKFLKIEAFEYLINILKNIISK